MWTKARAIYIRPVDAKVELQRFANLLWALVARDFRGTYRRSLLGPAWAILQPMLYMIIFSFIRGVLDIESEGIPYVIFTYSALVPWTFFSNAVMRCAPSIITNVGIIKKVPVAREVFLVSGVISSFIDLIISSSILIVMVAWFRIPVGFALVWLPVLILMAALLGLGVGMAAAAVGTYKRDIIFGIPFLMQIWLLTTPIMYPITDVPSQWQVLYKLNPMVVVIEGFRGAIIKNAPPDLNLLAFAMLGILLVWLLTWPLFRHMSQYFADVL